MTVLKKNEQNLARAITISPRQKAGTQSPKTNVSDKVDKKSTPRKLEPEPAQQLTQGSIEKEEVMADPMTERNMLTDNDQPAEPEKADAFAKKGA